VSRWTWNLSKSRLSSTDSDDRGCQKEPSESENGSKLLDSEQEPNGQDEIEQKRNPWTWIQKITKGIR
jgi:hypothetical protein